MLTSKKTDIKNIITWTLKYFSQVKSHTWFGNNSDEGYGCGKISRGSPARRWIQKLKTLWAWSYMKTSQQSFGQFVTTATFCNGFATWWWWGTVDKLSQQCLTFNILRFFHCSKWNSQLLFLFLKTHKYWWLSFLFVTF